MNPAHLTPTRLLHPPSPTHPRSQGSRPTARGKKRERRAHDPLERYARKLDRWVDKHPVAASILSFGVLASAGIVFWNVFGEHLKWVYGKYLAEACDPYVAVAWAKAAPHFAALRALAEENAGAPASFVANLFRARPLKKTIEL
jgi:hypothetical protein